MNDLTIFPLDSKKAPAIKGSWQTYKGEANTPMVGVMIPEGVIVLDLDTYKSDVSEEKIEDALGCKLDWESSRLQTTLHGGRHYAFRVPNDCDLTNGANVLGVSGFDTRSSGKGYIATGKGYTNLTVFGVIETLSDPQDLPELPEEAVKRLSSGALITPDNDDGEAEDFAFLEKEIARTPMEGITADDVREYLALLPDSEARDSWLTIMQAIKHQLGDTEEAYAIADEFSKRCPEKYNARKNKSRWDSIKGNTLNPVTFGSVKKKVEVLGVSEDALEKLLVEAREVKTLNDYNTYKEKIQTLKVTLAPDELAMIASELKGTDIAKKVSISDIKKALRSEKKEIINSQTARPDWAADWVYLEKQARFSRVDNPDYIIGREAFDMKYAHKMGEDMFSASRHLAENEGFLAKAYDSMFLPQAASNGPFFRLNGKKYLNSYSPSGYFEMIAKGERWYTEEKAEETVEIFLKHCENLISNERERHILLSFLAYPLKNLGERLQWMLLLQGSQGSGKTFFSVLLQKIFNGKYVNQVSLRDLESRFNSFAAGSIFNIIEEMRINGTNKLEISDNMKPLLSNDTVPVERKGIDTQMVTNTASYLGFTNHKNALILDEDDRRYAVIYSDIQDVHKMKARYGNLDDYFSTLFGALDDGGAFAIADYLINEYELPDWFNAKGRAPETAGRKLMISLSQTPEKEALLDKIDEYQNAVINDSIFCVTEFNAKEAAACFDDDFVPIPPRTLSALLSSLGYDKAESRIKVGGKRYYYWVKGIDEGGAKEIIRTHYDGSSSEDDDFDFPF